MSSTLNHDTAAQRIQDFWRRKHRKDASSYLTTSVRVKDVQTHATLTAARAAAHAGGDHNSPRARWWRAIQFASELQDGNNMLTENGVDKRDAVSSKFLETQHWLELVDGKHRYGSNLKWYHRWWQTEDTDQNFFRWLDKGDGKDLSLEECSRDQLEKERIIYLSAEQRLNYLVEIDAEGRLRWARSHDLVDTTPGRWVDSENGQGIIPDRTSMRQALTRGPSSSDSSVDDGGSHTEALDAAATHYAGPQKGKYRITREFRKRFTLRGVVDRLLRKTVRKNTWIYVSDKHFNIFIGIKKTGTFQHSSLLGGGVVTSAGLITVKQGIVYKLSPLSGHYRTSISHFEHFVDVLRERGVDMHKARISRAVIALWGIERIKKAQKKKARVIEAGKENLSAAVEKITEPSSWKRDVLEGRRRS